MNSLDRYIAAAKISGTPRRLARHMSRGEAACLMPEPPTFKPSREPEPVYSYREPELEACTRRFPERTVAFYKRIAITALRNFREFEWLPGSRDTHMKIAKYYGTRARTILKDWEEAINA